MPSRQIHIQFDNFLIEREVLIESSYSNVHTFMDKGTQIFGGKNHRDFDFYHAEKGIRQYLNGKVGIYRQELTTSWLRAALGHLCLDDAATRRGCENETELFKSAYQSMVRRGYTKKYFRQRK